MFEIFNNCECSLKSVNGHLFLDYLALELNYNNNYNFSDYYNIFNIFNKDKNIIKFNNLYNNNRLLDLINNIFNNEANVKLYYNEQNLLACFEYGDIYYNILININNKIFKSYYNIFNFIGELEEYIEFTN